VREWRYNPPFLTSILEGGKCPPSRPIYFTPREIVPSTDYIWGWVGPRAGLDEEKNIMPRIESRPSSPSPCRLIHVERCQVQISLDIHSLHWMRPSDKAIEPYSGGARFEFRRPGHRLSWLRLLFSSVLPSKYGDSTLIRPCSLPSISFLVRCPSITLHFDAVEKPTEEQRCC
jgi:hypothetical protein